MVNPDRVPEEEQLPLATGDQNRLKALHELEQGHVSAGVGSLFQLAGLRMGGPGQSYPDAQFVSNIADYGMNIQAAMDAPRFRGTSNNDCNLGIESRAAPTVLDGLRQRGRQIKDLGTYDLLGPGVGQVVMRNSRME
jgi:gamma-glutamyltranspeptidase